MKKLTMDIIMEVNKLYDYDYPENKVQSIYEELMDYEAVSINDIIEEFEMVMMNC